MNSKPLLSIITVCFQDKANLVKTFPSIAEIKQLRKDMEYVVIDGGSNDGTAKMLNTRPDLVDHFISEPDEGTFAAMNKGIRLAKGKWIIFINAGDAIAKPALFAEIDLMSFSDVGLVYGNTLYEGRGERKPFPEVSLRYGLIMACHQSMFFNKDVLGDDVFYSMKFRLFNDYELVCRVLREKYPVVYLDVPIAYFLGGGISSKASWEARRARYFYVAKYFGVKGLALTVLERFGMIDLPERRL